MTMTNKERKADLMVWQLETQAIMLEGCIKLARERMEIALRHNQTSDYFQEQFYKEKLTSIVNELREITADYKAE